MYLLSPEEIGILSDGSFELKVVDSQVLILGKWPKLCLLDTHISSNYIREDLVVQIQISDECLKEFKKQKKN